MLKHYRTHGYQFAMTRGPAPCQNGRWFLEDGEDELLAQLRQH